jgi:hypothetical protein
MLTVILEAFSHHLPRQRAYYDLGLNLILSRLS